MNFSDNKSWFNIKLVISTHDKYVKSGKFFYDTIVTCITLKDVSV